MSDLVQLIAQGLVQARMSVPVDIAPYATDAIDVFSTLLVEQGTPLSPVDDKGFLFAHLGERVPDDFTVPST